MKNIYKLLITDFQKESTLFILLVISATFFEVVSLAAFYPLLSMLADNKVIEEGWHKSVSSYTGIEGKDYIYYFSLFTLFLNFIRFFLKGYSVIYRLNNLKNITEKVTNNLFLNYLNYKSPTFIKKNSTLLLKNITKETIHFQTSVLSFLVIITESILVILISITLIYVNLYVFLVSLSIILSFTFIITYKLRGKTIHSGLASEKKSRGVYLSAYESFSSIHEIRLYNKALFFKNIFSGFLKVHLDQRKIALIYKQLPSILLQFLIFTLLILAIILMLELKFDLISIIPIVGFLLLALQRLSPTASNIYQSYSSILHHLPSVNIVLENYSYSRKRTHVKSSENILPVKSFGLKNTSFSLENKKYIINNLSVDFQSGKFYSIIGKSGSGKSTLLNLLTNYYKLEVGSFYLNDNKFANVLDSGFLNSISIVPQKPFILNATILNNIAFGVDDNEIDFDLFKLVIKQSQLTEFIDNQPDGLLTMLGENALHYL